MNKWDLEINYRHSLPVWEGQDDEYNEADEILIGSEIEPIKIFEIDLSHPYCRNGIDIEKEEVFLIAQKGRYLLISRTQSGYDHEVAGREVSYSWEAYELPSTMKVDRCKLTV